MNQKNTPDSTTIQPWLSVQNAVAATNFYITAFDALETYRMETPDGLVVKLSINGAEFWVSGGITENSNTESLGGETVRMILVTDDPEMLFKKALQAGASEIFPIDEAYGWKLGRLADPFGLHWEIGHPVSE